MQSSAPPHEMDVSLSSPPPRVANRSIRLQPATSHDHDAISAVLQSAEAEDEYTLTAYGDISLGEVTLPPLPAPKHSSPSPLQLKYPQPRLRLKVRRPPMPKRRTSYIYVPDPLPYTGGMDPDERWPGSPRPIARVSLSAYVYFYRSHPLSIPTQNQPWVEHQPLVYPLPVEPTTPRTQKTKPAKNGGSSLGKLFDELIPRSPSIRLSPPGSPASHALSLPQEEKNGIRQGWDPAAKPPPSSPTPATPPRQDKSKEAPWRIRLPPRLPIPKWDV